MFYNSNARYFYLRVSSMKLLRRCSLLPFPFRFSCFGFVTQSARRKRGDDDSSDRPEPVRSRSTQSVVSATPTAKKKIIDLTKVGQHGQPVTDAHVNFASLSPITVFCFLRFRERY